MINFYSFDEAIIGMAKYYKKHDIGLDIKELEKDILKNWNTVVDKSHKIFDHL